MRDVENDVPIWECEHHHLSLSLNLTGWAIPFDKCIAAGFPFQLRLVYVCGIQEYGGKKIPL